MMSVFTYTYNKQPIYEFDKDMFLSILIKKNICIAQFPFPQISHVYFYNIFQKTNILKRLIFYVFTYNEQPMDEFDKVLDEFDKNNKVPLVNQLYLL